MQTFKTTSAHVAENPIDVFVQQKDFLCIIEIVGGEVLVIKK